jgi:hypothetical protein
MTCIVGIKTPDGVILGADSLPLAPKTRLRRHMETADRDEALEVERLARHRVEAERDEALAAVARADRARAAAVLAEREACAQVAEETLREHGWAALGIPDRIAANIRART